MKIKTLPLIAFAVFLLLSCQQGTPKTAPPAVTNTNAEELPWASNLDLVCGMTIKQTVEDTAHFNGKIYGFCNPNCKEKFQENPAKYGAK